MAHKHSHTEKIGWTILLNIVITIAEYIGGINSNENFLSCHICSDEKNSDKLIKNISKKLEKFNIGNISIRIERDNLCKNSGGSE